MGKPSFGIKLALEMLPKEGLTELLLAKLSFGESRTEMSVDVFA